MLITKHYIKPIGRKHFATKVRLYFPVRQHCLKGGGEQMHANVGNITSVQRVVAVMVGGKAVNHQELYARNDVFSIGFGKVLCKERITGLKIGRHFASLMMISAISHKTVLFTVVDQGYLDFLF